MGSHMHINIQGHVLVVDTHVHTHADTVGLVLCLLMAKLTLLDDLKKIMYETFDDFNF